LHLKNSANNDTINELELPKKATCMSEINVRQARLDDTEPISLLFRQSVPNWQRLDQGGQVHDLPYEQLTIYEHWLHGGAWMSVETSAIHLSHLLRGAGLAFVATVNDHVLGYAEAYPGDEPDPYGAHLHIAHLTVHPLQADAVKSALTQSLINHAQENKLERLTVSFSEYDEKSAQFYRRHGLSELTRIGRYTLSAQTGQSFYKATEHTNANSEQIDGWQMTVGRLESSRQHWVTLMPHLWDAVPEIVATKTHRLHISAAGQEAYLCCQRHLYDPRSADVYCWSPKPITSQLLTAIRDWAHRQTYRSLIFAVTENTVKLLGTDAEKNPHQQVIYAIDL
jgi:ribosomal protein S18 acetylase RimI-like enzyme